MYVVCLNKIYFKEIQNDDALKKSLLTRLHTCVHINDSVIRRGSPRMA